MRSIVMWIFVGMFFASGVTVAVMAMMSRPVASHPFISNDDVLVIAHRGGRGLWPENTLYAFEQAADIGVDVLEMDIHRTKDSVLVVIHDGTVDRTTDGSGPVKDFTFEELRRLDAGYRWTGDKGETYPFRGKDIRIPTLEEVLLAFPDRRLNIEIKPSDTAIVSAFASMILEIGRADHILVASFRSEIINEMRTVCPTVATAATAGDAFQFWAMNAVWLGSAYHPSANAFQVPERIRGIQIVTTNFIRGAHDHNMDVHVWTINDPEDMERLVSAGVDGIMTDYPDRLISILGRSDRVKERTPGGDE